MTALTLHVSNALCSGPTQRHVANTVHQPRHSQIHSVPRCTR